MKKNKKTSSIFKTKQIIYNFFMNNNTFLDEHFDSFSFDENFSTQKIKNASNEIILSDTSILNKLSFESFKRLSFTFTKEHLQKIISSCLSKDASPNDKYVLACILQNAFEAQNGIFPLCQDTGIANIFAWTKGNFFFLNDSSSIYEELSKGTKSLYDEKRLRFSTTCPQNFYDEKDPKNNMPAQISFFTGNSCLAPLPSFIEKSPANSVNFIFVAKGGGSSNKTSFVQGTKAYLNEEKIKEFLTEEIKHLGTSACPPYTLSFVAGGLSPEQNLLTLKLATSGAYDEMTYTPNEFGFRDKEIENMIMEIAKKTGYGSQFGGTKFALDAVAVRLPRHGASCPLSVGVSCSAHRNLKAVLTENAFYLEKTVQKVEELEGFNECIKILDEKEKHSAKILDTNNGIEKTLEQLEGSKPGDALLLNGKILVARDAAHARWKKLLDEGNSLPEYTKKYPICYAGPARTPDNKIIGSFGPTTAGRMDSYAKLLNSQQASLVTLAKGNRNSFFKESCKEYKAFYLGTPGGIAALIASKYIVSQEIIDYEDLGMEAVRIVEVKNLPCFVITDNNGNDFYDNL